MVQVSIIRISTLHREAKRRGDSLRRSQQLALEETIWLVRRAFQATLGITCMELACETPSVAEARLALEVPLAATHSSRRRSRCSTTPSKVKQMEQSSKTLAPNLKECTRSFNISWALTAITSKDTLENGLGSRPSPPGPQARMWLASAAMAFKDSPTTALPRRWVRPVPSAGTATVITRSASTRATRSKRK